MHVSFVPVLQLRLSDVSVCSPLLGHRTAFEIRPKNFLRVSATRSFTRALFTNCCTRNITSVANSHETFADLLKFNQLVKFRINQRSSILVISQSALILLTEPCASKHDTGIQTDDVRIFPASTPRRNARQRFSVSFARISICSRQVATGVRIYALHTLADCVLVNVHWTQTFAVTGEYIE